MTDIANKRGIFFFSGIIRFGVGEINLLFKISYE